MDHRAASLNFIRATGLIPVRVQPGKKEPERGWDPRVIAKVDHKVTFRDLDKDPKLNVGALFHGRVVDVDIDSYDPTFTAALDALLPPTPLVWGRKGKRRSHRVYTLKTEFEREQFSHILKRIKSFTLNSVKYGIEIRGGRPETGHFAVLPGSFVQMGGDDKGYDPEGEWVEWADDVDTSATSPLIDVRLLVSSIRLATAAAIIAPYWQEGSRNDMSLALAGLCWRIRNSTLASVGVDETEVEEGESSDLMLLTQADTEKLVRTVCMLAGDDEKDMRSRILNVQNTWRKLNEDSGAKATGGKVFSEYLGDEGEEAIRWLYRLLSDNDGLQRIEELASKFALWYGPGHLIDLDLVKRGIPTPWMSREQATNSLSREFVRSGTKQIPATVFLYHSKLVPLVYGFTFDPSQDDMVIEAKGGGLMINQWRGFGVDPHPEPQSAEDVRPFLDYLLTIVANHDPELFKWVMAWLADMVQDPANKPKTALVLVGCQGAGKTFLGEGIMAPILGSLHYSQVDSIDKVTGKFNMMMDNKILVQCNEAIHEHKFASAQVLKSMITDDTIWIEPKNVNKFEKPARMRFLFTSNDVTGAVFVDASSKERRFTISHVGEQKATDREWWADFRQWTTHNLDRIMRYLKDYDYAKRFIQTPYDTHSKRMMQAEAADIELIWLLTRMLEGHPLSTAVHKHWWQALPEKRNAEAERKNALIRDEWPVAVYWQSIEADLAHFARGRGRMVYNKNIAGKIRSLLPEIAGSTQAMQSRVKYREADGTSVEQRIRYYKWPSRKDIMTHLQYKFGKEFIATLLEDMVDLDQPLETVETTSVGDKI